MKKIFYILIAFIATTMASANLSAQNHRSNQMEYEPQEGSYKFVIEGTVDLNIPDSCYNIYFTDIDGKLTDKDLVACVKVKDKKFRYETNIDVMKQGRIRAIMPGNKLCSAWINIYFIPGFTVYMTVHNGHFDIHNKDQYSFMVSAWQNEVPVSALLARLGMNAASSVQDNNATKMQISLGSYEHLINELKRQMDQIMHMAITYDMKAKESQKILNRIEQINAKMEGIVDDYSKSINF